MVDLGVDVVGPSGQDDSLAIVVLHPPQGAAALSAYVGLEGGVLGEAGGHGPAGLGQGDAPVGKDLDEPLGERRRVGQVEEGGEHPHPRPSGTRAPLGTVGSFLLPVTHGLDVVADDLGVGGHDRAVEVVGGALDQLTLVENAGEPDRPDALGDEGLDVPVGELGRVADVLRGNRVHAGLEELVVGAPRDHDAEAQ